MNKRKATGSIIGSMHRTKKVGQTFILNRQEEVFKNKVYNIDYVLDQNVQTHFNGQIIDIDIDKTSRTFSDKRPENFNTIVDLLKSDARKMKRKLKLSASDSYLEALKDDTDVPINEYLKWLEQTIIQFAEYDTNQYEEAEIIKETITGSKAPKEVDLEFESMKIKAKEIGVSLRGVKTKEKLQEKINLKLREQE